MEKAVFINNENMATFICPKCGKGKTVDASEYMNTSGPVRIKYKFKCDSCDCGTSDCKNCEKDCQIRDSNIIFLERRKYFRKTVNLSGTFAMVGNGEKKKMIIADMSRTGLRFRPNIRQELRTNDKLMLEFHLDDSRKTPIKKDAWVKIIKHSDIIAEYCSTDINDKYDKAIGVYLFS